MVLDKLPIDFKEKQALYKNTLVKSTKKNVIDDFHDLHVLDVQQVINQWNTDFSITQYENIAILIIQMRNTFLKVTNYSYNRETKPYNTLDTLEYFNECIPVEQANKIIKTLNLTSYNGYGVGSKVFISKETAQATYNSNVGVLDKNKALLSKEQQEEYYLNYIKPFENLF